MLSGFTVTIDHAQLLVEAQSQAGSGLVWTDDHVAQGFVWSPGCVAFGVPDHDGQCRIEVDLSRGEVLAPQALWAVRVPFVVEERVQVGTLFDAHGIEVPSGSYNLTCQAWLGTGDCAYVVRLTFSPSEAPEFRILKRGGDITTDTVLRRDADPMRWNGRQ